MIKLENEKLSELIIVWYNGRHSQWNVCIEVNVYSYIGIKTGAHCSMFYLETEHLHLSAILSTVHFLVCTQNYIALNDTACMRNETPSIFWII